MTTRNKQRLKFLSIIVMAAVAVVIANPKPTGVAWLDNITSKMKFNLGPDLQGGVVLTYEADMKDVESGTENDALQGVVDVIERRVNAYGVSEARVEAAKTGDNYRVNIEIPGVKDIEEAKRMLKETPILEFKEEGGEQDLPQEQLDMINQQNQESEQKAREVLERAKKGDDFAQLANEFTQDPSNNVSNPEKPEEPTGEKKGGDLDFFKKGVMVPEFDQVVFSDQLKVGEVYPELVKTDFGYHIIKKTEERGEGDDKEVRASHILLRTIDPEMMKQMMGPNYQPTGLTGKELKKAQLVFNQQTYRPEVSLEFTEQGRELFRQITERNMGKTVAIFLDGEIISAPTVQSVIHDGNAVINGQFSRQEAQQLAQRLNAGALPVPISLVGQQSVGPSLGKESLDKSLKAGLAGLAIVAVFMVAYYRLAGLVAVFALVIYTIMMVAIFKLSSVTPLSIFLTLSGIAGFILSIGMAVDANILIFERMKEELRGGRSLQSALDEGFKRAWPSIRDGNYSTLLTCIILIMFGMGFIKGFALILALGVIFSMFTAIVITRLLMRVVLFRWFENHKRIVL